MREREKTEREGEGGSEAREGVRSRAKGRASEKVHAWDSLQLRLTEASKLSALSSKWAGSHRVLQLKHELFRSLHNNDGLDLGRGERTRVLGCATWWLVL